MKNKHKTETVFSKRLRLAMSASRMNSAALADAAGLTETAVRKLTSGKTRVPRVSTLEKIASALKTEVRFLSGEENPHLQSNSITVDLERDYGPAVRSCLQLGDLKTLWLTYDVASEARYDQDTLLAVLTDREPELPKQFIALRCQIEAYNEKLKADSSLGDPFFDGPTFCLSRYRLSRSADGMERKTLSVEFSKSRYANNMTAKAGAASNMRRKALQDFRNRDQPIEWLASGVGVAVVVFCDNAAHFVAAQRSDTEKFRSREFDISVVEGINPVKDKRSQESSVIYIYDAVKRAVFAELGFTPDDSTIFVIGFGVDLEYYQWNFIAYVDSPFTFHQIEDFWHPADESDETIELRKISVTPSSAASFLRDETVWSCGAAALYISLLKRFDPDVNWRASFHQELAIEAREELGDGLTPSASP